MTPVMGYDPDGTWNWKKFLTIVAVAVVVVAVVATVVTFCASSVAGTIAITSTITIASKTLAVGVLQYKKSKQDGDSSEDIATDIIDALFYNGFETIGKTIRTKTLGFSAGIYSQSQIMQDYFLLSKIDGYNIRRFTGSSTYAFADRIKNIGTYMKMLPTKFGYLVGYGFAALSVVDTVISCVWDDPEERVKFKGYKIY